MKKRMLGLILVMFVLAGVGAAYGADTLSVLLFDRATAGFQPEKGVQAQYIIDNVKKDLGLDVKFVTMPRFPDIEKVNVLMASGQAPDVTFLYDENTVMGFIKQGGLTDLGPLLDKYAPTLKDLMGEDVLSYGQWGGKQWAVPAMRTIVAKAGTFIRKDWLNKLGIAEPKTTQQWYDVLKAFKTKDPGNLGGKVQPMALQGVDVNNIDWGAQNMLQSFLQPMSAEDKAVYGGSGRWFQPGYKEGVRFLNKLYNEGLMGPDFMLDKDGKQRDKDLIAGYIGSLTANWDDPYRTSPGLQSEMAKNVPGALYVPIDPFVNYAGKTEKVLYNPNGFFIFVPKFSKQAVNAVKYLEWLAQPKNYGFLTNGTKGVHYTDEVNGIPINYVDQAKLPDNQKTQWIDFAIILNGKEFGSDERNAEAASLGSSYSPGYASQVKQGYIYSMKNGIYPFHWDVILAQGAKYTQILNQKGAELWVKAITGKPGEFDATYDAMTKEYLDMGGQAVIDERRAAYKAIVAARAQ
jgi:putative aldouronate transport system substrate-binding protein